VALDQHEYHTLLELGEKAMNWRNSRVLITGIDGFVGSHLANLLIEHGAIVGGILHKKPVPQNSGLMNWGITESVRQYVGNIVDEGFVKSVLDDYGADWVFHLAAQSIVTKAEESLFSTLETNIKGTYNLLSLSSEMPTLRGIIVASSDKAYGTQEELPYTEQLPLLGGAIYDTSKACADLIAQAMAHKMRVPLCVTRCANIYGPGDWHLSRIVPDTIQNIIHGKCPVIRGNGLHRRDFIYIDDAVSAYLKLAEYAEQAQAKGEAFNFGSGKAVRVIDIVHMIMEISGSGFEEPIILGKDNVAEIEHQYVDATKSRKLLGWNPKVSLSAGLEKTCDWYYDYNLKREL
jgi:CDP-glucose 4,6-dehydratase